ncbi:oligosaccharide flippase family protein [Marinobacter sp. AN1]|uniref:oligosaccharide flippase family protein n=1 Tax=Marinobacter sp. AN1 TaxID=2886046 RepID=UPI00222F7B74|nr:oligosaccharide flippase family protein [Marinobacter sp. AN1]UZD66508.1 oligosaccharide flippase family protein [Marinobacter sp. AN1]
MPSVRQAIVYSSAARYVMSFLGLASSMLVSRLLTPDEIGTFAIASAIVMIMSEFRMLGAGGYLVREEKVTKEKVRSALGLTILVSWGFGIVILVSAWPISILYELPSLALIFSILSLSFFLAPYISIPASLLSRKMNFRVQFKIRFYASLVGFSTTIGLIVMGASYYALALGQTAVAIVSFVMYSKIRPQGMVWLPHFKGISKVASFGAYTSLASLFRKLTVTMPDMIIGKMGTTAQVGMFSRGLGFIQFVSQTIIMGMKPVSLPYLSDVKRAGGDLSFAYTRASVMAGGLIWPVLAVASIVSLPAIRMFFGDQWDAAAPPASMLAYWAMLRVVHLFAGELLTAIHKEKILALKEGVVVFLYFGGIILSFPRGLLAVAVMFVLVAFADLLFTTAVLVRYAQIKSVSFFSAWIRTAILTILCWSVAQLIYMVVSSSSMGMFGALITVAAVLPLIWVSGLFLVGHSLRFEIINLYDLAKKISALSSLLMSRHVVLVVN